VLRKGNIVTIMEEALTLVKKADVKYLSVFELIGVRLDYYTQQIIKKLNWWDLEAIVTHQFTSSSFA
jgi:hypothetical protein